MKAKASAAMLIVHGSTIARARTVAPTSWR
jgi:hypothetical protein